MTDLSFHMIHTYLMLFILSDNKQRVQDYLDCIIGMREYDVPYHVRFAIDNGEILLDYVFQFCNTI